MESTTEMRARLVAALDRHGGLAIAVSGGIDSMTLAHVAHRFAARPARMVHAVSPAVPALATARVRDHATRAGWDLAVVDAGEFADPAYRANPVNRCYFCKSNLYDRIAALFDGVIASGANLDDLGDFRPGMAAAAERRVVHPFVDCGIGKTGIRALAADLGLTDIADLPAQPCLASRVETGIAIDPGDMAFIDDVERHLRARLGETATVRCRITRQGVVVELADADPPTMDAIAAAVRPLCAGGAPPRPFAGVRPYRRGSAFVGAAE
ncbi:MAG: adenine nucleotide alpha hydrolase [Hyphomicrobiales bacterium]|nr:adenine nucleotide alpha hydrolase [Hyphomicrobiales bacterium]MCP5371272.1 adenine nucleotide alpha hydrolase [Hyphomicrobiales bacterium]